MESLQSETSRHAMGAMGLTLVREPEGRKPIGEAHGRPPDLPDLQMQGSAVCDSKAHVRAAQARRLVHALIRGPAMRRENELVVSVPDKTATRRVMSQTVE